MADKDEVDDIISKSSALGRFFSANPITADPKKVKNRWSASNKVFVVYTENGTVVLKQINECDEVPEKEIAHQKNLCSVYPGFLPEVLVDDRNVMVMEFVEGQDLLTVYRQPFATTRNVSLTLGETLARVYNSDAGTLGAGNGQNQLAHSMRYRGLGPEKLSGKLEQVLGSWIPVLVGYPKTVIHNDLNTANVLVTPTMARAIDPRADLNDLGDIGKDLGRVIAGIACQIHDSGYTREENEATANLVVSPFHQFADPTIVARTAFYVGQSYLSFSRWDTDHLAKLGLFATGMKLLEKGPGQYSSFQDLSQILAQALNQEAYYKR